MRKKTYKLTDAVYELKFMAAGLAKATDLPSGMKVPRSVLGHAATVPAPAMLLRKIGEFLMLLAEGKSWQQQFIGPLGPPEHSEIENKAMHYHVARAKGKTGAQAAAIAGAKLATMKRHASKYRELVLLTACATDRLDGKPPELTHAKVEAYRARVAKTRARLVK